MILDLLFSPDVRWEERAEDVLGKIASEKAAGGPMAPGCIRKIGREHQASRVIDENGRMVITPKVFPGMQVLPELAVGSPDLAGAFVCIWNPRWRGRYDHD